MNPLTFHHNWNGKLSNSAFTTLRLWNPSKYDTGVIFDILLTDRSDKVQTMYGEAAVADVKKLKINQINEFIARLDTGYSAEETINILKTMYKNKKIDWQTQDLALVLLVKVKSQPIQKSIF
jgi:hypothetical protein